MSPKAVKERLKMMDDLWLLSVKLMNSKKVNKESLIFQNSTKDKIEEPDIKKTLKNFPISGLVQNWYFKVEELSQSHYLAEGRNIYNHQVSYSACDYDEALNKCKEYAIELNKQIQYDKSSDNARNSRSA